MARAWTVLRGANSTPLQMELKAEQGGSSLEGGGEGEGEGEGRITFVNTCTHLSTRLPRVLYKITQWGRIKKDVGGGAWRHASSEVLNIYALVASGALKMLEVS